jgi:hypothetical protein
LASVTILHQNICKKHSTLRIKSQNIRPMSDGVWIGCREEQKGTTKSHERLIKNKNS